MKGKHTVDGLDIDAAFASILETASDDTAALVLNHLELSRRAIEWLMQRQTSDLAGERYSHEKPNDGQFSRWGSNPGSVAVGGQRVRVEVPRVRDMVNETTHSPEIYAKLRHMQEPPLHIMQALMRGLGTRQFQETAEVLLDSFGLSKSSLSAAFVEHSSQILEAFLERPLNDATYVAMFIDGKVLQNQSMVVAIGITEHGDKRTLGLTQATTENAAAIGVMLRDMITRGLDFEQGLLIVIDGGTGLRKAIDDVFGIYGVVQRCHVHKLRNVLSHLSENERQEWQKILKEFFSCEDYDEATKQAKKIHSELLKVNIPAARSFNEGLDDVLTLARLGLHHIIGRSFRTTNIIESINAGIARYTRHVTRWTTADQRLRWTALALLEMEPSWNKVHNFRRLPMLQRIVQKEIIKRSLDLSSSLKSKRISTRKRT